MFLNKHKYSNVMQNSLSLNSIEEYKTSILTHLHESLSLKLDAPLHMQKIKEKESELNAYEHLKELQPIDEDHVFHLGEDQDISLATNAILNGKVFWEHTAAGEATRLGLGTKYLLNLKEYSLETIAKHIYEEQLKEAKTEERKEATNRESILENIKETIGDHSSLLDLSLGERHMYQLAFDITNLAKKENHDPSEVLSKQCMLLVVNEKTQEDIINNFIKHSFFGFNPKHVYFMVQQSFNGMHIEENKLTFDETSDQNKRLHNHGQLVMQKTHDKSLFRMNNGKEFILATEYESLLTEHDDLISFNIEDLGYLNHSLDMQSISLALELKEKGYNMVMEIVAQNPIRPQKGGACFFDPIRNKNVMIESFQLGNVRNEDITHLNKNVNHYTDPVVSFKAVKEKALPVSFTVKQITLENQQTKDYIFPCPVQGDVNFLVNTAFVMRSVLKSINNWKSPATTPATIVAMKQQDAQEGFKEFISRD